MALLPKVSNTEGNNEGLGDRSPLDAGDYAVVVVKSEFKKTKAGTGHYLAMQAKVAEGPRKGSMLFINLNLDNPNPIAVEIAQKELNSICQAVGKVGVEDSEELHGIPFVVTVVVTPGNSNYPPGNEIKAYKPYGGEMATADPSAQGQTQSANTQSQSAGATGAAAGATSEEPAETKLPWE